jgi:type II secretory pathway pseudopilin PulG
VPGRTNSGYIGFEAVVAFAVLSIALAGIYHALSLSYKTAAAASQKQRAVAAGRSILADALTRRDTPRRGELPSGETWVVQRVQLPEQGGLAPVEWLILEVQRTDGSRVLQLRTLDYHTSQP